MNKKLLSLGGLIAAAPIIVGAIQFTDTRYALAEDQQKLENRVKINELTYLYQQSLSHLYFLTDQATKYPDDLELKLEVQRARRQTDDIAAQLAALKGK